MKLVSYLLLVFLLFWQRAYSEVLVNVDMCQINKEPYINFNVTNKGGPVRFDKSDFPWYDSLDFSILLCHLPGFDLCRKSERYISDQVTEWIEIASGNSIKKVVYLPYFFQNLRVSGDEDSLAFMWSYQSYYYSGVQELYGLWSGYFKYSDVPCDSL